MDRSIFLDICLGIRRLVVRLSGLGWWSEEDCNRVCIEGSFCGRQASIRSQRHCIARGRNVAWIERGAFLRWAFGVWSRSVMFWAAFEMDGFGS